MWWLYLVGAVVLWALGALVTVLWFIKWVHDAPFDPNE